MRILATVFVLCFVCCGDEDDPRVYEGAPPVSKIDAACEWGCAVRFDCAIERGSIPAYTVEGCATDCLEGTERAEAIAKWEACRDRAACSGFYCGP